MAGLLCYIDYAFIYVCYFVKIYSDRRLSSALEHLHNAYNCVRFWMLVVETCGVNNRLIPIGRMPSSLFAVLLPAKGQNNGIAYSCGVLYMAILSDHPRTN